MQYVGLDVHSKCSTFCILDENGRKIKSQSVRGTWDKLLTVLGDVKGPFAIAFEASCGYGYLYERLGRIAARVVVAHPGQLRLIFRSKQKNDRVDAEKLAKLLYLDEVPPVYVPKLEVQAWRGMIEHRQRLIGERTRAKNQMRSLLRSRGVVPPARLWQKRGMAWLKGVGLENELDQVQRDILLERLESLSGMAKRVEKGLACVADRHPGVALLRTIPGIGIRTSEAVVAYMDDPGRFSRTSKVASYFGVVPSQDQSGGTNRLGHITRQGPPTVRSLLTEAAWQGIRRSATIRSYFQRIQDGDPKRNKIAIVATAHYLLRVMHAMLRSGETWRNSPAA